MSDSPFAHRQLKSWQKIVLTLPESYSDIIASFLSELTGAAVEQSTTLGSSGSSSTDQVIAYIEENDQVQNSLERLDDFLSPLSEQPDFSYQLTTERIIEEDWNKNWKQHFHPFKLTDRLVIKPSWEEYTPQGEEVVIEMDPGMAFGTGLHASTRLALQLIEALFRNKPIHSVLDVGTGTGILGMSSALFGAQTVIGLDNDIDARIAARENIAKNNLQEIMTIPDLDLCQINDTFDLVVANITLDVLTLLATQLAGRMKHSGSLILSGILTIEQSDCIQQTFKDLGLTTHSTYQADEWTAIHLIGP